MNIKEEINNKTEVYIILSKSKCHYCNLSKLLLSNKNINFSIINCDNYLESHRTKNVFLEDICDIIGYEYMMFPMIFKDKEFIGGYEKLKNVLDNEVLDN